MIFYNPAAGRSHTFVKRKTMRSIHITMCLAMAMLLPVLSFSQEKSIHQQKEIMENNKAIIQHLYENVMNKRDMSALPVIVSEEYTGPEGSRGIAGFTAPTAPLIAAFPDIQWKISSLLADGDKVVAKWTWYGTQSRDYKNIPATGKAIHINGVAIYQLKNGKIIAGEVQTDRLGFLTGLGVLPADIAAAPVQEQVQFIDKFLVPAAGIAEFKQRVALNRAFIKTLPGFISDAAYEYFDEQHNLVYVTIAQWENNAAVASAKEQVQAEYKRTGFDMPGMLKRLGITMDRGSYTRATE